MTTDNSIGAIAKVLERVFLSPRIAATIFLACAAILFGTRLLPEALPLVQQYKPWIWALLLVSGLYSLTFPVQRLASIINRRLKEGGARRRLVKRLHSLTTAEKHLLQWHVESANGVESWSVRRMEINSLAHDGLLGLIQQLGNIGYFKLPDAVREHLLGHPDLIATPDDPRPARSRNEWMI